MTARPTRSRLPPRLTRHRRETTPSAGWRAIRSSEPRTMSSRSTGRGERAAPNFTQESSCRRRHARQPEVVAQRRALVLMPKQPARLKLRHDQVDEVDQRAREVRGKNVETVRGFLDEPLLERIGHALGGSAEHP